MMRLIDADELVEQFNGFPYGYRRMVLQVVAEAPTVDASLVVRCYECFQSEPCLKKNSVYCNKIHDAVMRDWYCADGKRKN